MIGWPYLQDIFQPTKETLWFDGVMSPCSCSELQYKVAIKMLCISTIRGSDTFCCRFRMGINVMFKKIQILRYSNMADFAEFCQANCIIWLLSHRIICQILVMLSSFSSLYHTLNRLVKIKLYPLNAPHVAQRYNRNGTSISSQLTLFTQSPG